MPIPSPRLRWALTATAALASAGCFSGFGQPENPFRPSEGADGEVRVAVENQNFSDATVWLNRGGERFRLGIVTGKASGTFTLPWNFTLPMTFEVELIGGRPCETRPLDVGAGESVWLRIPVDVNYTECTAGIR